MPSSPSAIIRMLIPIAACGLSAFSCDPCEDCTTESSMISVVCYPPAEDGNCNCNCRAGKWVITLLNGFSALARETVYLAATDEPASVHLEAPPCSSLTVTAYFLCMEPPNPTDVHSCSADHFYGPYGGALTTGCGGSQAIALDFCAFTVRTKLHENPSR